jgi:Transcriptional regulators
VASEVRLETGANTARAEESGPSLAVVESAERARSQSEAAYLRIRDRIVSLDMPPGSVVNEARLREELVIGRTPIREALQRLALENLVKSIPHRGTFVTDVNITDLARITEVRVVLESHAARLAAERLAGADRLLSGNCSTSSRQAARPISGSSCTSTSRSTGRFTGQPETPSLRRPLRGT